MKNVLLLSLFLIPFLAAAQSGFRSGFIVDRSGARYEGMLKLVPGTDKKPGHVIFREGSRGKKETYSTDYIKSFKIGTDSFTVVRNIALPRQKVRESDFARVVIAGAGGVVYHLEYNLLKSSGHAATEYKTTEEQSKYFYQLKNAAKLVMLNQNNFREVANIVSDCDDLKTRIATRKVKFTQLEAVAEEYSGCK